MYNQSKHCPHYLEMPVYYVSCIYTCNRAGPITCCRKPSLTKDSTISRTTLGAIWEETKLMSQHTHTYSWWYQQTKIIVNFGLNSNNIIYHTCRTELQKLRACVDLLSSGTASSMTGMGDCQSSTVISLELGNSE